MKKTLEETLKVLVGLPWWAIGRVVDLVWLEFGQRRRVRTFRGTWKLVGDWALHLQCSWRIGGPQGLIVASDDRFCPAGDPNKAPKKWKWDTLDQTVLMSELSDSCQRRLEAHRARAAKT